MARSPTRSSSLLPREHGAYAELLLPMIAALVGGGASLPAASLAIGATAAFLAHEPVLLLLGHRGPRALREDGARARGLLLVLVATACVFGGAGLAAAPRALVVVPVPLVAGVLVAVCVALRREKSLLGEIAAAAALSGAAPPVAAAAGVPAPLALAAWAVFATTFSAWTWVVRSLVARAPAWLAPLALVAAGAMATIPIEPRFVPALAPAAIATLVLFVLRPHAKHLRRVGWSLVAGSLVTTAIVAAGTRASLRTRDDRAPFGAMATLSTDRCASAERVGVGTARSRGSFRRPLGE